MRHIEYVDELEQVLKKAQKIIITAHAFPDIDAIGSCLALAHYFGQNNEVKVWIPKIKLEHWQFLPLENYICMDFPIEFLFDTCIVCDCSTLERIEQYDQLKNCKHSYHLINSTTRKLEPNLQSGNIMEEFLVKINLVCMQPCALYYANEV